MIETDQQRRWWFATHPEYSHRSTGRRSAKDDKSDKLDPGKVDAWADERLKHEKDPVAIELLKQAKFWFGTEFASKPLGEQQAFLSEEKPVASDSLFGGKSGNESLPQQSAVPRSDRPVKSMEQVREEDEKGLIRDPHWALDVLPVGRGLKLITSPKELIKYLLKRAGRDVVVPVAKKGGDKTKGSGKRPPARLPPKGSPERKAIEAARQKGVAAKQRQELENIRGGGKGSGVWTKKELEEIRQSGEFPPDAQWHHDPTVANRPDLAADPRVVHPLRGGRKGHLWDGHQGNYQNPREE